MVKYVKSLYWASIIVYGSGTAIFPYLYFKTKNIVYLALMLLFLLMLVKEYKGYKKYYN